jgi:hypothetical protein
MHFGAEFEEFRRHRLAKAGTAACNEDFPACEKLLIEHGSHLI